MKQEAFSEKVLTLSVLASVFAQAILQTGTAVSARTLILQGLPMALVLTVVSAFLAQAERENALFSGGDFRSKVLCGGFALWFGWELAETLLQAQNLCWTQFSSMAVLGLLPLLLWAGWKLEPAVFARSAPILGWAAGLAGLLWLWGLRGQLHWENLLEPAASSGLTVPLYAEYFALPFLCKKQGQARGIWLPVKAFCLTAVLALGAELFFGARGIPAEGIGHLTRFDALVLLVWLAAALYRVCFLVQAERLLLGRICKNELPEGERL